MTDTADSGALLAALADPDPGARALAAGRIRQVDLDDLQLLDRVLALCRDQTPLPDAMQPQAPEDPFAAFFGASTAARPTLTVADKAKDRLVFTGVIDKPQTVERLAAALDAEASPQLVAATTKLLVDTRWTDRLGAVRALGPRLMAQDAPLYEVIVRVGEAEHRALVGAALAPYRSRAVNELLNHGPSKALMEDALAEVVDAGGLVDDEPTAADALTLLVSWDSRHAGRVARAIEPRFGWAVLGAALDGASADAQDAGARCRAWLAQGLPAPRALVAKLGEVLKAREPLAHFPLDAWMRYAGGGVEIARAWKAAAACHELLADYARDRDQEPQRAWEATEALVDAGLHGPVVDAILAGLADDSQRERWSRGLFERLASAQPPIPGLVQALTALAERHPEHTRSVVGALQPGFPPDALRELAERLIAVAEARPVVRKPSRKGLIHEEREGIDTAPLQPIVRALQDPALSARLDQVLPYVRAAD